MADAHVDLRGLFLSEYHRMNSALQLLSNPSRSLAAHSPSAPIPPGPATPRCSCIVKSSPEQIGIPGVTNGIQSANPSDRADANAANPPLPSSLGLARFLHTEASVAHQQYKKSFKEALLYKRKSLMAHGKLARVVVELKKSRRSRVAGSSLTTRPQAAPGRVPVTNPNPPAGLPSTVPRQNRSVPKVT